MAVWVMIGSGVDGCGWLETERRGEVEVGASRGRQISAQEPTVDSQGAAAVSAPGLDTSEETTTRTPRGHVDDIDMKDAEQTESLDNEARRRIFAELTRAGEAAQVQLCSGSPK